MPQQFENRGISAAQAITQDTTLWVQRERGKKLLAGCLFAFTFLPLWDLLWDHTKSLNTSVDIFCFFIFAGLAYAIWIGQRWARWIVAGLSYFGAILLGAALVGHFDIFVAGRFLFVLGVGSIICFSKDVAAFLKTKRTQMSAAPNMPVNLEKKPTKFITKECLWPWRRSLLREKGVVIFYLYVSGWCGVLFGMICALVSLSTGIWLLASHYGMITSQTRLSNISRACDAYYKHYNEWPKGLADLDHNPGNIVFYAWPKSGKTDGWGREIVFKSYDEKVGYGSVSSLGRDGMPGGKGDDSDIEIRFGAKK
jgi:hypothetical protein